MRFKKLITAKYKLEAGLSPILYHFTPIHRANDILQLNKFNLPTFLGSQADKQLTKNKMYYLATSRQKAGGYHRNESSGVVFELDGTKLSHNYGGTPFDYWGEEWRQTVLKRGQKEDMDQYQRLDENEDRLLTDKPSIPNASKYIKSVHILINREQMSDNATIAPTVRLIMKQSKQKNIPVFVYDNPKDFLIQNKMRALPFAQLLDDLKSKPQEDKYWFRRKGRNPFARYMQVLRAKKQTDLKSADARFLYYDDSFLSLEADLHNTRRNTSEEERPYLEEFLKAYKKMGATSPRDFFLKLREFFFALPEGDR